MARAPFDTGSEVPGEPEVVSSRKRGGGGGGAPGGHSQTGHWRIAFRHSPHEGSIVSMGGGCDLLLFETFMGSGMLRQLK